MASSNCCPVSMQLACFAVNLASYRLIGNSQRSWHRQTMSGDEVASQLHVGATSRSKLNYGESTPQSPSVPAQFVTVTFSPAASLRTNLTRLTARRRPAPTPKLSVPPPRVHLDRR